MTNCIHDHGRWGKGDQIGAAHLLTPERTVAAMRSVSRGQIIDMSHVIEVGAPRIAPNQTPYLMQLGPTSRGSIRRRRAMGAKNDAGSNLERMELTTHVGTHIDSLGHFTYGDRMHGGYSAELTVDDFGLVNLGIENCPPIVTRGVCIDVSAHDGSDHLAAGRAVTKDDLQRALDRAKQEIKPGDVVCIQTGWGRFFMKDNDKYVHAEPGIDLAAAQWLTSQDVVAIGCDNMAIEVLPGTNHPEAIMPVHQHCLAEAGVYLIENMVMDQLVSEGISSFCFMLAPVKFKGATGCPVRPVAIV
ncbi:MAG: cyclase family protein [Hyphomicrobiaceae bacterium]